MSWHDFFYFSKGERRALILLLCLITVAGILLILNDKQPDQLKDSVAGTAESTFIDNTRNVPDQSSDSSVKSDDYIGKRSSSDGNSKSSQSLSSSESGFHSDTPPNQSKSENKKVLQRQSEATSGRATDVAKSKKETVPERVKRITSSSRPSYPRIEKFEKGVVVELNTADTTILKKIPGIGSSYARRIVGYRNLLGGYYSVTQLSEVYGIDEDRYNAFVPWFTVDPLLISKLRVNQLSLDSLRRHPYVDYNQARILTQLRRQKGKLTGWENLQLFNEFTDSDKMKLQYYLSFE
jgi:DNA uptake protein ComE-like DNA-binding protein